MKTRLIDYDNKSSKLYYGNKREEMLKYIASASKRNLDVGCSEGKFARSIKNKNKSEVWGIELSKIHGKSAQKFLDKVIIGTVEESINQLPKSYFDSIIFNDVLEHLVDPYEVLSTLKKNLSPNGVIVASIPNVRYYTNLKHLLFDQDWKYENEGILDRTHLRFFTKKSIQRMFHETGYDIVKIEGINKGNSYKKILFEIFTFGLLKDIFYLQFAVVAKPRLNTKLS
jgi:2-polyprenyl-3-methyl-5-hydroxy-6-metoxy-1,4-benzoquinol methylase